MKKLTKIFATSVLVLFASIPFLLGAAYAREHIPFAGFIIFIDVIALGTAIWAIWQIPEDHNLLPVTEKVRPMEKTETYLSCSKCGSDNEPLGTIFCSQCGSRIQRT